MNSRAQLADDAWNRNWRMSESRKRRGHGITKTIARRMGAEPNRLNCRLMACWISHNVQSSARIRTWCQIICAACQERGHFAGADHSWEMHREPAAHGALRFLEKHPAVIFRSLWIIRSSAAGARTGTLKERGKLRARKLISVKVRLMNLGAGLICAKR